MTWVARVAEHFEAVHATVLYGRDLTESTSSQAGT